jgi:hypothetical protein
MRVDQATASILLNKMWLLAVMGGAKEFCYNLSVLG